jgi:hypothetical protein
MRLLFRAEFQLENVQVAEISSHSDFLMNYLHSWHISSAIVSVILTDSTVCFIQLPQTRNI